MHATADPRARSCLARRRHQHIGRAFGEHMIADAAQQQVFGGRLAMLAEHDKIAVLLLLVFDDALGGVPLDDEMLLV